MLENHMKNPQPNGSQTVVWVFCDIKQNVSRDYEEAVCTDKNFNCENYLKVKLQKYCLDVVVYSDYMVGLQLRCTIFVYEEVLKLDWTALEYGYYRKDQKYSS